MSILVFCIDFLCRRWYKYYYMNNEDLIEARISSVYSLLCQPKACGEWKGTSAEGGARHASFLGPQPNRGGTVTLGLTCCAVLMQCIIILHFVPVFKPVFLLSRVWQQNGLNAAAGLCLPPANLRRQLHIGNGMGLGTEAESPNVRWGSGGKDGSLR